jgi:hypothetical protein
LKIVKAVLLMMVYRKKRQKVSYAVSEKEEMDYRDSTYAESQQQAFLPEDGVSRIVQNGSQGGI